MAEVKTTLENGTENGTEGTPAPAPEEKKFTQAELDSILGERLAKQKRQYDEKYSDYDDYKAWKETQKTEAEKQHETEQALAAAQNKIAALEAEKKVVAAGVRPEFVEFVSDKVLKTDGDFDKNLADLKKQAPQYFGEVVVQKISTTPPLGGNGKAETVNQKMNAIIRGVRQ
jgi:hypothetical protein